MGSRIEATYKFNISEWVEMKVKKKKAVFLYSYSTKPVGPYPIWVVILGLEILPYKSVSDESNL